MDATRATLLAKMRAPSAHRSWEEFYALYAGVILAYAHKLGLSDTAARDVLQDTMVTLMRILPEFEYRPDRGKFRNFLLTIVHRKALAEMRRAARSKNVSLDAPEGEDSRRGLEAVADPKTARPDAEAEKAWAQSLLEEALRRVAEDPSIDARTADVFRLYVLEGRPAAEVAARFSLKENAVYQVKNRLTRRLAREVRLLREAAD